MTRLEEFTEYGYQVEYPDQSRCAVSPLSHERERALGQFRTLECDPHEMRLVFVSRRVTRTPWTDEETTTND